MLREFRIKNYKSIEELTLQLGRFNVFIGENGAGKSNILEALALTGAADAGKLDNEFLASRGIRVTSPQLMRSAFDGTNENRPIVTTLRTHDGATFSYTLSNDNKPYSSWTSHVNITPGRSKEVLGSFSRMFETYMSKLPAEERISFAKELSEQLRTAVEILENSDGRQPDKDFTPVRIPLREDFRFDLRSTSTSIADFVIYSPENSALREFQKEGQIEPLGVNGEGLLKLLQVLQTEQPKSFKAIRDALRMLSWFDDLTVVYDGSRADLSIVDCFIDSQIRSIDQRSANEGFLYVAFYFALLSTDLTPKVFAVDNIDASLNPKLCEQMTKKLASLAKRNRKQVILTTHNPAVLDGLDLNDSQQRLFIVSRDLKGRTKVRRFQKSMPEGFPTRLSELFLRGTIGGLPKSF
ncbi:AAA family ATPase [Sphingomonas kaistensis]|uniref:AAA family ATPase n=1 Tax=Sphingomonas kaistensis TaxID=298708 RepID=A0ABZ2G0N8_9SPHN